ncbi:unnamed protein product [Parnassius apollo]|uniref:(apollo) hypothetical protein n=1 Tax=Parnassius apollo TaxID=110799 RepID=A0A8S3WIK0_PARAO|nr:unnamed protein product [Parnassius apollo]
MEEDNETPSSSTLKSASKERKYVQKFKASWLEHPDFKTWLKKSDKGETKAYCKICDCDLVCGMSELLKHKNSAKHTKKDGCYFAMWKNVNFFEQKSDARY